MQRIVNFGAGPIFKGGMANYNTSLAKAFDSFDGVETHIVSWTHQYPSIIPRDFIDRKSRTDLIADTGIKTYYITNYNNPFTWIKTVKLIKSLNPTKVIFQWSISIQGLPIGFIARRLKKSTNIEIVFDLHFVKQKEGSIIDKTFTKYGISCADTYIVHSYKTGKELEELFPKRKFYYSETHNHTSNEQAGIRIIKLFHPVYDMFKPDENFDVDLHKKNLNLKKYVFLFFGFIRKYKGLHNAIRAFAEVAKKRDDVSLLIVGESFWNTLEKNKLSTRIKKALFGLAKSIFLKKEDDEGDYRPFDLIKELNIEDKVTIVNDYVPNEEVNKYFQVSDAILLFYLYATPSGVESIAYNFKLPILATRVGHFPETVKDGFNGYLAEPENIESMALAMIKIIENPIPRENISIASQSMSWTNYARAIL